jgi:S-adenosylmethionine:tRNA ribosyltransferase-isomerase
LSDYRNIRIDDYSYDLPEDRIAKYPVAERDSSKLLIWNKGAITKDIFKNLPSYLPQGAMLVFNNTRVIHARLLFRKETGSKIEIFCLEPVQPSDYQLSFQQTASVVWECMLGNAKKWKEGFLSRIIHINGTEVEVKAIKLLQGEGTYQVRFTWNKPFTFAEIIEAAGTLPIPPYLNRASEPADESAYQTVYARNDGSVAAPTAGLHFTENVLETLARNNFALKEITLHVGAGTFQPVKSETISDHKMHHEKVIVSKTLIKELLANKRMIIAVGTTSIRSLESLYWLGLKLKIEPWNGDLQIDQWEPYENDASFTPEKSLEIILNYLEANNLELLQFSTRLIILPGYDFKMISGMITNFHQPQSTLLLLISAFLGEDWKKVYQYAMDNEFRFLSYGDSNLYLKASF